jgi:glycosyltransferase involved in cell wall biosynthesis
MASGSLPKQSLRFPANESEERAALMPSPPRVSIVLPTYNGSKYIAQNIESVLNQTFADWELIVVDDCSTDKTGAIVLGCRDPRIHYCRNGVNCTLPRALNRGFRLASGEYLTWTSDDNWYAPNAIERMVSALDANPHIDLVASHFHRVDEDGKILSERTLEPAFMMQDVNPVGACFLYRRSALGKVGLYNPKFSKAEDAEYWMRMHRFGLKIAMIDEYLYFYRLHSQSLTATNPPGFVGGLYESLRQTHITWWMRFKVRVYRRAVKYSKGHTFFRPLGMILTPKLVGRMVERYEDRFRVGRFSDTESKQE